MFLLDKTVKMKESIRWTIRQLILPLTPFFIGALVRWIYLGFSWSIFDPSLLSFSMAMLCYLVIISSVNIHDQDLRKELSDIFAFTLIVFLVAFAVINYINISIDASFLANIEQIIASNSSGIISVNTFQDLIKPQYENSPRIERVKELLIIMTFVTLTLTIYCKHKYKLEV